MNLKRLLNGIETIDIVGDTDIDIRSINYNSQKIEKNDIFVAIKGLKTDGHKYINSAIKNGAKAIVLEDMPENIEEDIIYIRVLDSRNTLARLSSIYYNNPSKELNLIGITGTNGKTTTSYILKSIYEAAGHRVGIIGTIGNIIGDELIETNTTTPDSLELQRDFRIMKDRGIDTVIMEVSSHALDLDRVAYSDFDIGVFTNLSVDHLDYHKDLEDYLNAKKKLFKLTSKKNIINLDEDSGKSIIE
ncbi:MAG: UDP-N-acetylmuramyl-tripeptide synthetase, partial [Andreesenia angusta]|nr:UDP-N-acetylmuramyl-tripeptide synthetase [Andreesenia angusta]